MANAWKKWAPAVAVPVVIVAAALVVPAAADAAPNLPSKTPTQVLALVTHSDVSAFSGTVTLSSDLGLPSLSSIPGGGSTSSSSSSTLDLLTGSHAVRVYRDDDKVRLQEFEQLAERDVIVNGSSVWVYDSAQNTAEHTTLSSHEPASSATLESPDAVASEIVADLEPSSTLTVSTAQRVAGRDAYTLVLTPNATDTLVGTVEIAVDASTGLPLKVEVIARGESSPAWSIGFDSLSLSTPSASLFEFTAPSGAKVTTQSVPDQKPSTGAKPTVTGSGWDAIVGLQAGDLSDLTSSRQFTELTTTVPGGRLLHTSLMNVLITDSGEVLVGSVSADALEAAATGA